jgi:hypothetical protein
MKIIASRPGGYIVDMTDEEITDLSSVEVRHGQRERQVGRVFQIDRSWMLIQRLKERREQLEKTASQLRCMADLLELIATTVDEAVVIGEKDEL